MRLHRDAKYAVGSALLIVGLVTVRAWESPHIDPRVVHCFEPERRVLQLDSSGVSAALRGAACTWPDDPSPAISLSDIEKTAAENRVRLFGDGLCHIGSVLVGDLDGDRSADAVAELICSDPSADMTYGVGLAVFLGRPGGGVTLVTVHPAARVRLERLCDGVLTVEDKSRLSSGLYRDDRDDASESLELRLLGGRLRGVR